MLGSLHATNMEMIDTTGYIGAKHNNTNKQRRRRRHKRRSPGASGINRHKPDRESVDSFRRNGTSSGSVSLFAAPRHVEDVDDAPLHFVFIFIRTASGANFAVGPAIHVIYGISCDPGRLPERSLWLRSTLNAGQFRCAVYWWFLYATMPCLSRSVCNFDIRVHAV